MQRMAAPHIFYLLIFCLLRILTATLCPVSSCCALFTLPKLPWPSVSPRMYLGIGGGEGGRKGGREEGRKGGREEGRKGGREEGRKEGREEGRKGGREEGRKGGREEGRKGGREGEGEGKGGEVGIDICIHFAGKNF